MLFQPADVMDVDNQTESELTETELIETELTEDEFEGNISNSVTLLF